MSCSSLGSTACAAAKYCTYADSTCSRDASFFGGKGVLPEGAGYGIVLGFGIFFSLFTTTLVRTSPRPPPAASPAAARSPFVRLFSGFFRG